MPDTNNKEAAAKEAPKPKQSSKKKGVLPGFLTLLLALTVIAAVFGGASYLIIHNNLGGIADSKRQAIQKIPFLKDALPPLPDPLDPKYMTPDDIKNKYMEFRANNEDLQNKLKEAEKQLDELKKYKEENEKELKSIEDTKKAQDARQTELDNLKKTVDQLIANGDKAGLKQYFEKLDPAGAKEVYAEVLKEEQTSENEKKFAQVYEAMDASAAAKIFEQMGNSKLDLISRTLRNMKKESAAAILTAMTPDFASQVTQKLDELYK